jgi:hypothetical protein
MADGKGIVRILLLVVAGVSLIALALDLRRKHQAADTAVQGIEDQLAELDPVTRAAVLAKLSADAAKHVKASRHIDD